MAERVLIVEDEARLAKLHEDYLNAAGFETACLGRGDEVLPEVQRQEPALIILDLMLPKKDGLEVCKELRAFSSVPIIMVTARVEEIDRLLGLELGADDYICKPFSPREVVARVKTVLRRVAPAEPSERSQGGLSLDEARLIARVDGAQLDLTALEFRLLSILAEHPGRVYSRGQLMTSLYSDQRVVCDRTIDSHIKKLRKKISAAGAKADLIQSVYGVGYKYEPLG